MPESLTETAWLDVGLHSLATSGPDGLKLRALCDVANRTRGSFYYHFKDHKAFVQALLERWAQLNTEMIVAQVESSPPGDQRRQQLADLALSLDFNLERAVRRMAVVDENAADAVRSVDGRRVEFAASFYSVELGVSPEDGQAIGEVMYAAFVGMMMVFPDRGRDWQTSFADWLNVMVDAAGAKALGNA